MSRTSILDRSSNDISKALVILNMLKRYPMNGDQSLIPMLRDLRNVKEPSYSTEAMELKRALTRSGFPDL